MSAVHIHIDGQQQPGVIHADADSEFLRMFAINRVREELQTLFEIFPEDLQRRILEIERTLATTPVKPEVRKVELND